MLENWKVENFISQKFQFHFHFKTNIIKINVNEGFS
jgi:hypothetical protein